MSVSLSQKRLKELLNYNSETGLFVNLTAKGSFSAGAIVGYKKPNGYICIRVDDKIYSANKLAFLYMTGEYPSCNVICLNGIKSDNRFNNLIKGSDKKPDLNSERLKELLKYNPETGDFTWNFTRQRSIKGSKAGHINQKGYVAIGINGKVYRAHRLAWLYMTGEWPPQQIDHDNRIKSDNRWFNISLADNQINQRNMPLRKDNKSGAVGVFETSPDIFTAYITVDGKNICLKTGCAFEEAKLIRKEAEKEYGFHVNHGSTS